MKILIYNIYLLIIDNIKIIRHRYNKEGLDKTNKCGKTHYSRYKAALA
jgi:hypothetical protein